MCGILFDYQTRYNEATFVRALDALKHRGPDNTDYVILKGVKLGHQRLSIIDLKDRSNQPMTDVDDRFIIVFNGEIFNFEELKKKYNLKTTTTGDTEVILLLYKLLGESFLTELDGMFAFCILDKQTGNSFIARDRYGIKPLFYIETGSGFVCSSEIKPLLQLLESTEFDEFYVRQYKKMRGVRPGYTVYSKVKEFLPGSYSVGSKISQKPYWACQFGDKRHYDEEIFENLFVKAVKDSTVSNVSYDCMLSGGLDSSIIAAITTPKNCWVIGTEKNNEFQYSDIAANFHNLKLNKVMYEENDFMRVLDYETVYGGDILSVPNEVLINIMSDKISTSSKVVLCGEGADELFMGYDRIFRYFSDNKVTPEALDQYYCYSNNDDMEVIEDAMADLKFRGIDLIREFFIKFHLPGLLKRVDRHTMRHGVEARVPFLSNKIFDFVSELHPSVNISPKNSKIMLKKLALTKNYLPATLINRKKIGFPVDLNFKTDLDIVPKLKNYEDWFLYNLTQLGWKENL